MATDDRKPRKTSSKRDVKKEGKAEVKKQNDAEEKKLIAQLEKYRYQIQAKYGKEIANLNKKQLIEAGKEFGVEVSQSLEDSSVKAGEKIAAGIATAADKVASVIDSFTSAGISEYFDFYEEYASTITSHLIGTGKTFTEISESVKKGVGTSSITTVKTVLENLNKLVSAGITQNVEQRAFLMSVQDRIVESFDMLDNTLLQLNRLNRADSSTAYLGMESALQEYFNSAFFDSSYLENMRDSVSASILDATALMGQEVGAAFEFNVQKWLGAFYSVGASTSTISSIATAIGQLGSGDVSSLSSNTQMSALFASAADRVGLSYGQLLLDGLDESSINSLLYGIYEIVQDINKTTDNVSKKQLASLYGLNTTDIQALSSLSQSELANIFGTSLTYGQMLEKAAYEISQVGDRTVLSKKLDNLYDNVMGSIAQNLITTAGGSQYITYKVLDAIGDVDVNVFGLGSINLTNIAKSAIVGMGLISSVGDIISGLSNANNVGYNTTLYQSGGGYITGVTDSTGVSKSTNVVTYVGSQTSSDLLTQSIASTSSEVETITGATETEDTTETLNNIESNTYNAVEELQNIETLLSAQLRTQTIVIETNEDTDEVLTQPQLNSDNTITELQNIKSILSTLIDTSKTEDSDTVLNDMQLNTYNTVLELQNIKMILSALTKSLGLSYWDTQSNAVVEDYERNDNLLKYIHEDVHNISTKMDVSSSHSLVFEGLDKN